MSSFVISLDFELYWGVRDNRGEEYFHVLKNVHNVCEQLLALFEKYDVACTWATVGALFAEDYSEFVDYSPNSRPTYTEMKYSPYSDLDSLRNMDPQLLFAPDVVKSILKTKNQELGSHTFSHYYALEAGQNVEQFQADLKACSGVAERFRAKLTSIVFPRNQVNETYLRVCEGENYISYRGTPEHWAYATESREERSVVNRAFRLIDAYLPLSGSLRQRAKKSELGNLVNVPGSLFFRPYSKKLSFLERLKLWRLKYSMTRTAKYGGVFHIWWHPHNFGTNLEQNLQQIEELLQHYQRLKKKYNFTSKTMHQVAEQLIEEKL